MEINQKPLETRTTLLQRYKNARSNLLLVVGFTAINLLLAALGSDVMMLFSGTVPYFIMMIGVLSESTLLLTVCGLLAVVNVGLYLLCWFGSKKHYGWMIAALVLFIIDTLAMVALYITAQDVSGILDAVFHAWILVSLFSGVINGKRLRAMPEEEPAQEGGAEPAAQVVGADTPALAAVEAGTKYRVLAEAQALGRQVTYRRIKRINQLVIDGYIYDQVEMLLETDHVLTAVLDGHLFQAGFDGTYSYIQVDGQLKVRKIRFV